MAMRSGELAADLGASAKTLRFYERSGLLGPSTASIVVAGAVQAIGVGTGRRSSPESLLRGLFKPARTRSAR